MTVRPLNEDGKWQNKTEKEYLCVRDGEERGFTAAEFKSAQVEGWEKQYQYKVGKKKVYMTPSAAKVQGLKRVSKYPKSTKYGRQNPITARWNSEEQLVLWRAVWAEAVNRCLEQSGQEERIDHRSHAERGLAEQPTIHEGVVARAMEKKGIISDRCELNRQIKADNTLLSELKLLVKKLMDAVKNAIPIIAEAMETVRQKMIIFRYQLLHIKSGKMQITNTLQAILPDLKRYENVVKQLKAKIRDRRALLEEKNAIPAIQVFQHRELVQKIAALTEDIEELKNEKTMLFSLFDCADDHSMAEVKQRIASMEVSLDKLERQETKYINELEATLAQYVKLQHQASDIDTRELDAVRQTIRPNKEHEVVQRLQNTYGMRFDFGILAQGRKDVAKMMDEATEPVSVRQNLQRLYEHQNSLHHDKKSGQER